MILASGPWGSVPAPSLWTIAASVVALLGYAVAALQGARPGFTRGSLLLGWLAHGAAIVLDTSGWGVTQVGARFGFAPALSTTLWLVLAVYAVESRVVPLPGVRRTLALLGLTAVALALAYPGEVRPHLNSPWMPLHWVLGIASYGLFGAAVLHAALLSNAERQMRDKRGGVQRAIAPPTPLGMPLLRLEKLTFRFVAAGFVVLSAALVLGAWFADPWRWDHKSVFSVLAWVVIAALLAGRRAFGWRGRMATRWLYTGAILLLLAYVGSRFVLEVLLSRPSAAA
ncbi:cytochrome c biogenesis protein CcsA [Aquabacterium sp. A7-Y]|uniref:cytochrome C assembly family protein n=1 Tax=Aquabacterium sp. A7-Y TaxID=1349605 RepID=UPI00223E2024|nr:cytochrome c biogenesis protein CcsA [Aquabacterium sp. A7-Y]MCW7537469.1 cytochrome c biogenesis protein CcsA [Aquabacterium sp. A7-Y]